MIKQFLITRPNHDEATSYLHSFSKDIIKIVKTLKGEIHLIDLEGNKATRNNLESSLIKSKPGLIFLNGHGNKSSVTGHKNEVILDEGNIINTKDKIVYALSCDSLEELGIKAIEWGTKAYIGYKGRFMIIKDPSRTSSPDKDNNALPFRRACFALINSLVFGSSVQTALSETKKEYRHSIRSYGTSEDDPYGDVSLIRFALAWDLTFLDMYGDSNASFK